VPESPAHSRRKPIHSRWVHSELGQIDLGDDRLNDRLLKVTDSLSHDPEAPINMACNGWQETKAAYRLFANEKMEASKVLNLHKQKTRERMKQYPIVLAIQDTTYLNYTTHRKTQGLGPIGSTRKGQENLIGMVMHNTLAVTPQGLPLGMLAQDIWVREGRKQKSNRRKYLSSLLPTEEKESKKWLQALRETYAHLNQDGEKEIQIVTVADRESDFLPFFQECKELNASFVIRSCYNRFVEYQDDLFNKKEKVKLRQLLEQTKIKGAMTVEVPAQDLHPRRVAHLTIKVTNVTIKKSEQSRGLKKAIEAITVIQAKEQKAPKGVEPLEWVLYTNLPVKNLQQAKEKISWYKQRWKIEVFHKILKTCCTVEACRLGTRERLERYLTLNSIIAWRLFYITEVNKVHPELPASLVFDQEEIEVVLLRTNYLARARNNSPGPPMVTVKDMVRYIAQLGGFLGRKGDGEPGILTVWRGYVKVMEWIGR
jgi:hypothetical protein